jgi:hypothetical protein
MFIKLIQLVRNRSANLEPAMILPLVVAVWTVVLALVVGLCRAARTGDLAQSAPAAEASSWEREPLLWQPSEHIEIFASGAARETESKPSLLRGGGIAA